MQALLALHQLGVLHRDLHAANVMLDFEGPHGRPIVTILDLGMCELRPAWWARLVRYATPPERRAQLGSAGQETLAWSAPETANTGWTEKSDVWSAAVLLYRLLTRRWPFAPKDKAILTCPRQHRPDCPDDLAQALLAALHPDPTQRLSAAGLLERLRDAQEGDEDDDLAAVAPAATVLRDAPKAADVHVPVNTPAPSPTDAPAVATLAPNAADAPAVATLAPNAPSAIDAPTVATVAPNAAEAPAPSAIDAPTVATVAPNAPAPSPTDAPATAMPLERAAQHMPALPPVPSIMASERAAPRAPARPPVASAANPTKPSTRGWTIFMATDDSATRGVPPQTAPAAPVPAKTPRAPTRPLRAALGLGLALLLGLAIGRSLQGPPQADESGAKRSVSAPVPEAIEAPLLGNTGLPPRERPPPAAAEALKAASGPLSRCGEALTLVAAVDASGLFTLRELFGPDSAASCVRAVLATLRAAPGPRQSITLEVP